MKSNVKHVPLTLITAMLLAFAVTTGAQADEQVRSETVKFPDLNMDSPAGVQTLYDRIHAAAKRVCSESDPILRLAQASCARKAEAGAIQKLALPQLTAFYQAKTGNKTE